MTQGRLHTQHRGELRLLQSPEYARGAASEFIRCPAGLPAPPILALPAPRCTAPDATALPAVKGVRQSLRPPPPQTVQGRGGAGACAGAAMALECLQARGRTDGCTVGRCRSSAGCRMECRQGFITPRRHDACRVCRPGSRTSRARPPEAIKTPPLAAVLMPPMPKLFFKNSKIDKSGLYIHNRHICPRGVPTDVSCAGLVHSQCYCSSWRSSVVQLTCTCTYKLLATSPVMTSQRSPAAGANFLVEDCPEFWTGL